MADKDDKKAPNEGEASFDPKPVHVGGESIVDRLLPHRKKIFIFILSGFAIWGVIAIVLWIKDRGEVKETAKVAAVLDVAEIPVRGPGEAVDPKSTDKSYGDTKERATAVLAALAAQGTDKLGGGFHAAMLVSAGKLDEAIVAYKQAQTEPGVAGVLARQGLGLAYELKSGQEKDDAAKKKDLQDALTAFQAMQPDDKGPGRAYALYHQGRILMQLDKRDEAKAALQKAKDAGKGSDLVELVDERLAMLGA